MSHEFYITTSYLIAALIVFGLIGWIWLNGRARKRELATLAASGFRRRPVAAEVESDGK